MLKFLLLRATTAAASMAIGEAGKIGRAPLAAGAQRRMATRGFFVSRCKAEGGGKNRAAPLRQADQGDAGPG